MAFSLDLRSRILRAYDNGQGTRLDIAKRFCVSLGMVKKLLSQRRKIGHIRHLHDRAGRKKTILPEHRDAIRKHLAEKPDMTLAELRTALGLTCTLTAIHYVLADMNLTLKKRRSAPPSKSVTMSARTASSGRKPKEA